MSHCLMPCCEENQITIRIKEVIGINLQFFHYVS